MPDLARVASVRSCENGSIINLKVDLIALYKGFIITSNPQPIGFRGILLVKRQKFFYCLKSATIIQYTIKGRFMSR